MGAAIRSSVVIHRAVAQVFAYVADVESSIEAFDPGVDSVSRTPGGAIGAGTRFVLEQTMLGRRLTATVVYTGFEPNRMIEFQASAGPLATSAALWFQEVDGDTRLAFRGDARPTGPFDVLAPLLKVVIGRVWRRRLQRLKKAIESDRHSAQP
jgi:hypothetical protein